MRSRLHWHMTLQPSNSEHMMPTPTTPSATMNKSCCILTRSVSPAVATVKPFLTQPLSITGIAYGSYSAVNGCGR